MSLLHIIVSIIFILSVVTLSLDAKSTSSSEENSAETDAHGFVKDPFIFYKWPGFGNLEWYDGHQPYIPPSSVEDDKKKTNSEENNLANDDEEDKDEDELADEEEDEEDDEPQDDYHSYHKKHDDEHYHDHYHKHWKKHRPTKVYSVGFGPAEGKQTWYGVLTPKVRNSLAAVEGFEENEESSEYSEPLILQNKDGYYSNSRDFERRNYYAYVPYFYK